MAQQGPPSRVYLADLTTHPSKISVCVRVMRKWAFNGNQPGAPASYIGLVLADEKGDSIYAQIHRPQIQQLDPVFQTGGTYMISKFTVRTSKTGYVPFERKFMIEFNAYSTVKEVRDPPTTFPPYVYHITPFANVNPYGAAGTKLIDLIGILSSVEDPKPLPLPKKERVATIRELTILNESDEQLKITLWDDRATNFCLPTTSGAQDIQSVVVLFVGCQPTEFRQIIQAYGGNACHWYFNPNIREAQPLYNRLKISPVPIHRPLPILTDGHQTTEPIVIEHKTIAELNDTDPYEIPKVGYKCTVSITHIHETPRWWYVGCEKCGKAPETETVPFLCRCGWTTSKPLYKLTFEAKDATAEARFFCYDEVSRRIIKRNIAFMLRQSRQAPGLPQHFQDLISRKFTFVVGVTSSSFQDPKFRTYLVKSVAVDYHEQAYIAGQLLLIQAPTQEAGTSSSAPVIPDAPNPQAQQKSSASPTLGIATPAPTTAITETPIKGTPPPLASDEETPTKDAQKLLQDKTPLKPRVLFGPTSSKQQESAAQSGHTTQFAKSSSATLFEPQLENAAEPNAIVGTSCSLPVVRDVPDPQTQQKSSSSPTLGATAPVPTTVSSESPIKGTPPLLDSNKDTPTKDSEKMLQNNMVTKTAVTPQIGAKRPAEACVEPSSESSKIAAAKPRK